MRLKLLQRLSPGQVNAVPLHTGILQTPSQCCSRPFANLGSSAPLVSPNQVLLLKGSLVLARTSNFAVSSGLFMRWHVRRAKTPPSC